MSAELIDGKAIAEAVRTQVAAEAADFAAFSGVVPHLAAVLVGEDPASQVYVRNKERACAKAGPRSTLHRLPASTTQTELLNLVQTLNADADVHGILVQLPLPGHLNATEILDAISPDKDVDAFHPENVG
ncbi:MAG: bifunctional 5,10-methylene-tetrahydrofolate dehydrogenase/5,10-methylene-tetrahydrofolate cyclohydrolase, partial [Planctomycetaceae bacterium]|nr:bifunctional 5,10-methylene-tetrahydrofolate dehydrogenase/5,10-methylene-tetrahydrofolate cyclohydrolase [Planctomycetaceae bacterium]